jgi:hypothetical protein
MSIDSFKRNIINHLIAGAEGRTLQDTLTPYFRAFTGAFDPGMAFTFYFEAKNRPLLLVYDPTPVPVRSSRAAFIERCERIKERTLPIADCIRELADSGYVTEMPLSFKDRPPLPPDYENRWRKYHQFYNNEMDALDFVCFSRAVPERKLYDLYGTFSAKALAG